MEVDIFVNLKLLIFFFFNFKTYATQPFENYLNSNLDDTESCLRQQVRLLLATPFQPSWHRMEVGDGSTPNDHRRSFGKSLQND